MNENSENGTSVTKHDVAWTSFEGDTGLQRRLLESLRAAADKALPTAREMLQTTLSPLEREIQSYVDSLNFVEGTWYRPIHNVIVPLSMIAICQTEGGSRDLVIAAQLHDIGYSAITMPSLLQGARLELKNARAAHMEASTIMSEALFTKLSENGHLTITPARKEKLLEIIATHDYPYIGKPLSEPEAILHRDADRCFVLSCVSFWKDYLALVSDRESVRSCSTAHSHASPVTLLEARRTSFLLTESPSEPSLNESSAEPMKTQIAQVFVEMMSARREKEIAEVLSTMHSDGNTELFFLEKILDEIGMIRAKVR